MKLKKLYPRFASLFRRFASPLPSRKKALFTPLRSAFVKKKNKKNPSHFPSAKYTDFPNHLQPPSPKKKSTTVNNSPFV